MPSPTTPYRIFMGLPFRLLGARPAARHVTDLEVRERGHDLDGEVRQRIDELPLPALFGSAVTFCTFKSGAPSFLEP
jgi:hypothetical protein